MEIAVMQQSKSPEYLITALRSFEVVLLFMNIDYTVIDCNPHGGISLTGRFVCLRMLCFPESFLVFEQKFIADVKLKRIVEHFWLILQSGK